MPFRARRLAALIRPAFLVPLAANQPDEDAITPAGANERPSADCKGCGGHLASTVEARGLHVLCRRPAPTLDDVPLPPEQFGLDELVTGATSR
ncbi:hypothetical protein ACFVT2_11865 [Streptomyces sp. NPDC058000]|uniref:hypothetical protein n=1 Tax=Streptomyces sp. NPDC058000 TaxID=3346299 RepID=UPI0036EBCE34